MSTDKLDEIAGEAAVDMLLHYDTDKIRIRAALDEARQEDRAEIERLRAERIQAREEWTAALLKWTAALLKAEAEVERLREELKGEAFLAEQALERSETAEAKLAEVQAGSDAGDLAVANLRDALAAERAKVAKLVEALEAQLA